MTLTVEVVIPAFQPDRSMLATALRSVIDQTHGDWHATVVNDGGAEDLTWCEDLDPRIAVITQPHSGVSAARNRAILQSDSELIAFLDSDDVWLPKKLAFQMQVFEDDPDIALCSTAFEHIGPDGQRIMGGYEGHNSDYKGLLSGCGIFTGSVVAKRSALIEAGLFDTSLRSAEDWALWLRVAAQGGRLHAIRDDVLAQYRLHDLNTSRLYEQTWRDGAAVLRAHRAELRASGRPELVAAAEAGLHDLRARTGRQAFGEARRSRQEGKPVTVTLRHLVRAVQLAPKATLTEVAGGLASHVNGPFTGA